MKRLGEKRCWIGEGPVWNERQQRLYFVNPGENEVCFVDANGDNGGCIPMPERVSSLAFDRDGNMIVSMPHGVFRFDANAGLIDLYDPHITRISHANDGKVGPDGCFYVGTQSAKRLGISDAVDGKLYRITPDGTARILLDNLLLSNGMDWSPDGTKFYHTDSDTHRIKEYEFDKTDGSIAFTGREVELLGVDGFSVDSQGRIWAACWGQGHIACIDPQTMTVIRSLTTPCRIPTSCCFGGADLQELFITSAFYDDPQDAENGWVYRFPMPVPGKTGYLFGERSSEIQQRIP